MSDAAAVHYADDDLPDVRLTEGRLYDPVIIFIAGALMTLGVAMVYSASVTIEGAGFDWQQLWRSPLKQGIFAVAGFVVMLVAAHVDYHIFAWARPGDGWRAGALFALNCILLLAVLVPGIGYEAMGARRAINIPGVTTFQPSELAKTTVVIWLAALLTRPTGADELLTQLFGGIERAVRRFVPFLSSDEPPGHIRHLLTGFLPAIVSAGLLVGLTGIEDFGTAALLGVVMVCLLWLGGARIWHLLMLGILGCAAGGGLVLLKPHRVGRILTWFAEDPDPAGAGYQISQALMAIGSGGWFGRGLGAGIQKYGYLPQDNNDFILAVICEELGILGGIVVVALFLALLIRGWRLAEVAPDRFGRLIALGLTLVISLQAAMNIAVVTNSVPTKGISLPFVSAGGSGIVFLGLAAGLLAAVGRTTHLLREEGLRD